MKKVLSLLVALSLAFGTAASVSAATTKKAPVKAPIVKEVESSLATGILKAFTPDSVTISQGAKSYVLPFTANVKIVKMGEEVDIMSEAVKGLKVQFKVMLRNGVPASLTYLDIPAIGMAYDGIPATSVNYPETITVASSFTAATTLKKNLYGSYDASKVEGIKEALIDYSDFTLNAEKNLFIGDMSIDPASIKLNVSGKELKVITDEKVEFDKTAAGDEAKLLKNSTREFYIQLETPLTAEQEADYANLIKLSYKVKETLLDRVDITNLLVNEDAYAELNGKEVSYTKAMYRGNFATFQCNAKQEIIYVKAWYRDLEVSVINVEGNTITFAAIKNGNTAFTETLEVNPGCTIQDSNGQELELTSLEAGQKVMISTEEAADFQVVAITLVK